MFKFFSELKEVLSFKGLPRHKRRIVFYSEGPAYWTFLGPMVVELAEKHDTDVCYLSSHATDPGLAYDHKNIHSFNIGLGACRTFLMNSLECDIAVMNLTDLGVSFIKRSPDTGYYINVRHALVSTHMMQRAQSFDHFDCVFISGEYQKREIRAREALHGLPKKDVFAFGYSRIDTMLKESTSSLKSDSLLTALLSPSWGGNSILETCGMNVIDLVLSAGLRVVIRPHPQMVREMPSIIERYKERYRDNPQVIFDLDGSTKWLIESDSMITDWSGVAFEYAFVRKKPVVFVDTPRKVFNPDYEELGITPIEVAIRERMGSVVGMDELHRVPEEVARLSGESELFAQEMESLLQETVFNVGKSASKGAIEILRILDNLP